MKYLTMLVVTGFMALALTACEDRTKKPDVNVKVEAPAPTEAPKPVDLQVKPVEPATGDAGTTE